MGRGLILGVLCAVVYIFVFGNYGLYRVWKQRQEIEQLEQTLEALRFRQEQLRRKALLLESDPDYIEKMAREEYGMVRKGDIIYKIVRTPEERAEKEGETEDEPTDEE